MLELEPTVTEVLRELDDWKEDQTLFIRELNDFLHGKGELIVPSDLPPEKTNKVIWTIWNSTAFNNGVRPLEICLAKIEKIQSEVMITREAVVAVIAPDTKNIVVVEHPIIRERSIEAGARVILKPFVSR